MIRRRLQYSAKREREREREREGGGERERERERARERERERERLIGFEPTPYIHSSSSSSLGFSRQGPLQRIFHLHSVQSCESSSVTSATTMVSLIASITLLLSLQRFPFSWQLQFHHRHPSPNIPIIFRPCR